MIYKETNLSTIDRAYTIAFSLRSGSNQICRLLTKYGLGKPDELFQTVPDFDDGRAGISWFRDVVSRNQSGGVFGSKMAHDHRARLDEVLRAAVSGYGGVGDLLPNHKWVWLIRRDKVAQAVSLHIAVETGCWREEKGHKRRVCDYDYISILSKMMILSANDIAWETYFNKNNIDPYQVYYEDFFSDSQGETEKLIDHLGGTMAVSPDMPDLAIQRDEQNQWFYERFLQDLARVGEESFSRDLGVPYAQWNKFFFERGWTRA
ncbi:Stf0 family sulfotransferase [Telmatospirillum sp.]|uniref:Stf0 family sulfotransferase n=1 Tax=Telmatospirillum sp. TaxID=2079197 RepID=UPI00284C6587|nr:Stf0 family sulfotransferase [Telmatospirillum sp.]MDR3438375.1 Stf0 family sulfotransferase [Telmatospirillum sp.]